MKLNIEEALKMNKGDAVKGTAYIYSFEYKTASNGKKFVSGQLVDKGKILPFKIWSDKLESFEKVATNKVVDILGTIDTWNGTVSLIVESVFANENVPVTEFLEGCDREKLEKFLENFMNVVMSEKARILARHIINGEDKERFCTEFAAKANHDAKPAGLLNHTVKMLRICKTMIENDPRLGEYADLLYCGIILHDFGKIYELKDGAYTKNSFVSHRDLGCEALYRDKQFIINLFDENFYYRLYSIIRGHHHIYGEKAQTVYAYLVHLIDMCESQATFVLDTLDALRYNETQSGEKTVRLNECQMFY